MEGIARSEMRVFYQALKAVVDEVEAKLLRAETWPWKGLTEAEQRLRLQRLRSVEREVKKWSDEAQDELLTGLERRSGTLLGVLAALAAAAWAGSKDGSIKSEPFSSKDVKSVFEASIGGRSLRVWIQRAFSNLAARIRRWIGDIGKGGAAKNPSRGLRGEIDRFCRQVSKTLARSYVNATFNRVNDKLFERSGVNKVVYRGILDDRTCWECRKQFGRVFDVNDPRRPSIPQHLNCRCFYEPYVEGLTSVEEHYETRPQARPESSQAEVTDPSRWEEWTEEKIRTSELDYEDSIRTPGQTNVAAYETEKPKTVYGRAEPEEFIQQRDRIPDRLRPFVTPYNALEYRDMKIRMYLSESGRSGYGITEDGSLISIFSLPGAKEGMRAVRDALKNGAVKLDCIDGKLPGFYELFGFKEYNRIKWEDKYAPADWDYSTYGRPDIVFMKLNKE